jgi:hypothetical protein
MMRLWSFHQPFRQLYEILDEYKKDHYTSCHVADCGTEVKGPDYAPGVNQSGSDNHYDERSQSSQYLFYQFNLL